MSTTSRRLHKWARVHAPTDQWRQRLLKSCITRMKNNRCAEHDQRRKLRVKLVTENHENLNAQDQNELLELLEEIDRAENQQMEQIFQSLQLHDDQHIDHLLSNNKTDGVLCPVCSAGCLELVKGVLGCRGCGLRIECKGCRDGLGVDMVRERLCDVYSAHGDSLCQGNLVFDVRRQDFGEFMWASCDSCKHECIVV